ncbi:hypothetical protein DB347_17670 [Opitutaceae bacterium EW11]|nr:hypothetical protein DB347_17670 [Opitutaceae bacterium EW11]
MLHKLPAVRAIKERTGCKFQDLVIRRKDAVRQVVKELTDAKGRPKFSDPNDHRVIFGSPLVDVAATVALADETAEICMQILELTHWQIRLLSKSHLLPRVAQAIPERYKHRVIYGVSTGTLDDELAAAFEKGTPLVSARIKSLRWLQDHGHRTFGMICPILPQRDPQRFAQKIAEAIRVENCEHVWAEVLNVRGESMARTVEALKSGGFGEAAMLLEQTTANKNTWESYARGTFEALSSVIPHDKLRFMQYVSKSTAEWWNGRPGALPLGAAAGSRSIASQTPSAAKMGTLGLPEITAELLEQGRIEREQHERELARTLPELFQRRSPFWEAVSALAFAKVLLPTWKPEGKEQLEAAERCLKLLTPDARKVAREVGQIVGDHASKRWPAEIYDEAFAD